MSNTVLDVFWGREHELKMLRDWNGQRSRLTVLYGRRRVGKTRLVEQAYQHRDVLQVEGLEGLGQVEQQALFRQMLMRQLGCRENSRGKTDWLDLLRILSESLGDRPTVVFLDEFQWLACNRITLISKLKHAWDNLFSKTNRVHLILCGSVSSFMIKKVLRSRALYGRVDREIHLQPLRITEVVSDFQRKRSLREIVEIFMTVGGIPQYLSAFDLNSSVRLNIERLFFTPNAYFVNEFDRLFASHFGSNPHYREILHYLAKKNHADLSMIKKATRLESGGRASSYLDNLEMAGFIERYSSVESPTAVRGSRYRLSDPYVDFYFRFVHADRHRINRATSAGQAAQYLQDKVYYPWKGLAFERFCYAHYQLIADTLGFGGIRFWAGPWFSQGAGGSGFQADLVFKRDDRVLTVCEMKFTDEKTGMDVIAPFDRMLQCISNPKRLTIEKVLVTASGPTSQLNKEGYFHRILTLEDLIGS